MDQTSTEPRSALITSEDIALIDEARRQTRLLDTYLFALDVCVRQGRASNWWRLATSERTFLDDAQSREIIQQLTLHHLLYEVGDVPAFCRVLELLESYGFVDDGGPGKYLLGLGRHLRGRLLALKNGQRIGTPMASSPRGLLGVLSDFSRGNRRRSSPRSAIVSIVLPDAGAVANFVRFTLPSLKGEGLADLAMTRKLEVLVSTHEEHIKSVGAALASSGVQLAVAYDPIPADLSAVSGEFSSLQRDWLADALKGLHLEEARRLQADFLSVGPYRLYSTDYLGHIVGAVEQGEVVVVAPAVPVPPHLAERRFRRRMSPGRIRVSAADLARLAIADERGDQGTVCRRQDFLPWRGETARFQMLSRGDGLLRIHSTHHELCYVGREALAEMADRFFMQPEGQLHRIVGEGSVARFLPDTRDVAIADIGDHFNTSGADAFAHSIGDKARAGQIEFFRRPICIPFKPEKSDDRQTKQIDEARVLELLQRSTATETPTTAQLLSALHALHLYEISEYGRENMNGTIVEGRRLLDLARHDAVFEEERKALIRAAMNFDYVGKALELAEAGGEATAFIHGFLVQMVRTRDANLDRAAKVLSRLSGRRCSVIGSVVWGDDYVDKFMDYCVGSLLAQGNVPALARRGHVVHSIVTTERDSRRIVAHPLFTRLSELAEVMFTCFSEELLQERERSGHNFYYFYGLLDHQNLFLAEALKADLYMLPVDCIYSSDCLLRFSEMLESEADCCSIGSIEADEGRLRLWLDGQEGRILDFPSESLLQVGCERVDTYFQSMLMAESNGAFCKYPRELVWPVTDGFVIHSVFMHPLAVSSRMLARPYHPQHENVDYALIPRLLQADGRLKVIEDGRQLCLVHAGAPPARAEFLKGGFSVESFLEARSNDYAVQRRTFPIAQRFPYREPQFPPSGRYPSEMRTLSSALARDRFVT